MPNTGEVQRALEEGQRRSRGACEPLAVDRTFLDSLTAPASANLAARPGPAPRYHFSLTRGEALTPEVLWRRFKWPIIGLGLFVLLELLSMGKLITVMGTHF